jgi:release factor glutamine methyltransferase
MRRTNEMTLHEPPIMSHQSVRSALRDGIAQLERAQLPSAALAAELLLMHALGRDRTWIYAHPEHELEPAALKRYSSLIARRTSGVPTQHLTGHQEFWGLDFEVTPDVLIPRPETEHVIEVALERLVAQASACRVLSRQDQSAAQDDHYPTRREKEFRIADVGTGSGCIAIALVHELPAAQIVATDISEAALAVARRNAARHNVADRIRFVECDLLEPFLHRSPVALREHAGQASLPSQQFDVIASNPPYIARGDAAALPREVREHEPEAALFGGATGAEMYEPLIAQAAALLKPSGILVLELGHDSAQHVSRLLRAPEWDNVVITNDLAGIARVASARLCFSESR